MARIVVIGGSGHVGTSLLPGLTLLGHEVVNVTRGRSTPYPGGGIQHYDVRNVTLDRTAEEAAGTFGEKIAALEADVVVDMICFTLDSCRHLVEALRGQVKHFLHCGTIWVYGHNAAVPATEDQPLNAFGDYGLGKQAIETWLLAEASRTGFPATVFRPGHIVGRGWAPLNPAGNFNIEVFNIIGRGDELVLPNFGMETVHHVYAPDVAQLVIKAISNPMAAIGEAFNAVSAQALNLRGYAEAMYAWFGKTPNIRYLPYDQWKATQTEEDAKATWEHIIRSPSHSIEKARRLLGYEPELSSLEAVKLAVWQLMFDGKLSVERLPPGAPGV